MGKNSTILSLVAVVVLFFAPSIGLDRARGYDDADWYRSDPPASPEGLFDEGPYFGGEEAGSIWISDVAGNGRRTSLEIPMGVWGRVMISPSETGELSLFCRYPTGTVDKISEGYVEAGRVYSAWYLAEWPGKYEVWYELGGNESEKVGFKVQAEAFEEEVVAFPPPRRVSGGNLFAEASVEEAVFEAAPAPSIGLAVGGAKDIDNFRENIDQGYMPLPTDVTIEGLFYDYYFDTGEVEACNELFCPFYSSAISKDPISGEAERYLSVGLNSGITNFSRPKLNLVIVLDYSGSMGSPLSDYYYDAFGSMVEVDEDDEGLTRTKMEIADQAVADLLGRLGDDDRFGLVVFSDDAYVVEPLTRVDEKNLTAMEEAILSIEEYSGTNMEAGMEKGTSAFGKYVEIDPADRENRIVFVTDAMPNLGETGEGGLLKILQNNADRGIYTTFIGVGVDFNTELVEMITGVRGANYYSVHSGGEFEERMDEEFDFMVTPLVFDLHLRLDAPGYRIEEIYGSPEAEEATGEIMTVNTLFPTRAEEGEVKGGIILIKLNQTSDGDNLTLKVSYRDRNGTLDGEEAQVIFPVAEPDFYDNSGIRKAILLSRYADLLKNWIIDEREALDNGRSIEPSVTPEGGIVVPGTVELGRWERQSMPLTVSEPYRNLFLAFGAHFENESEVLGDPDLQQEEVVLEKLSRRQGDES